MLVADRKGAAMNIDLTDVQAAELAQLLDHEIVDLAVEIRRTDSPQYRVGLRQRRTALREIREMLGALTMVAEAG